MMNELPIYRIVVNEDDETGVEFVSLVEKPAIKKDFLMFNEQRMTYAVQSEEKRIITGAAMLANKPIYRHDDTRGEYYVTFDADTIWTIAKKIARKGSYSAVNTDHATPVNEGVHMIEMYFVNRERGINPPIGFEDAEDGSMFVSYLVDNDQIWEKVKAGEWKGFSVEGMFDIEYEGTIAQELRAMTDSIRHILHQISKNNI